MDIVAQSLSGVPSFLAYFALGLLLLGAFLAIYSWVTTLLASLAVAVGMLNAACMTY